MVKGEKTLIIKTKELIFILSPFVFPTRRRLSKNESKRLHQISFDLNRKIAKYDDIHSSYNIHFITVRLQSAAVLFLCVILLYVPTYGLSIFLLFSSKFQQNRCVH